MPAEVRVPGTRSSSAGYFVELVAPSFELSKSHNPIIRDLKKAFYLNLNNAKFHIQLKLLNFNHSFQKKSLYFNENRSSLPAYERNMLLFLEQHEDTTQNHSSMAEPLSHELTGCMRQHCSSRGFKQTEISQHAHTFRTISVWRRIPDVRPSVSVTRIPTSSQTHAETVCCMEKHHVLDMKMPFSCWEHGFESPARASFSLAAPGISFVQFYTSRI
jgi:hypothetical protein